ncbi:variant leucine-rich repeat-containing protein [Bifidobacterium leontopitheci]|uniref:FHA domain-containing protein n=1 Tax=Bifidobacterium leontopitheci TaxID=2650774 RepID=A0A6I1GGZ3_9BIFI|nr:FHA domain-containing protein [Bifidobacterium leontopitheci]KAB7790920.1 hypothetical protein F7D09_0655 [Bifidobacterium leontopitheci]
MTGERTQLQWTVRIDGVDQQVKPGESIEIGRKPLRPLPDDGTRRVEIADGTRSMSKRHATFTVNQSGAGVVRDLGSTNGSYVVRGNGDLMRLPPQTDFLLPTSPMRLQFGDVPADFIRVERPVSDTFVVPDLFGYALNTVKQEPDVADMSVDDILDLRAGEPTAAISAANVRKRVGELNAAAARQGTGGLTSAVQPDSAAQTAGAVQSGATVQPDAGAQAVAVAQPGATAQADAAVQPDAPVQPDSAAQTAGGETVSAAVAVQPSAQPSVTAAERNPQNAAQPSVVQQSAAQPAAAQPAVAQPAPTGASQPSVQAEAGSQSPSQPAAAQPQTATAAQEPPQTAEPAAPVVLPVKTEPSVALNVNGTDAKPAVALPRDLFADAAAHDEAERAARQQQEDERRAAVAQADGRGTADTAVSPAADEGTVRQAVQEAAQYAAGVTVVDAMPSGTVPSDTVPSDIVQPDTQLREQAEVPQDHERFMPHNQTVARDDTAWQPTQADAAEASAPEEDPTAFKPAFEPGSVFDLVSKGALNRREQIIEVDGYTSEQAKTTDDYNEQFEIANRRELLPFLAMNTSLYDEMYSWLEAQGNADVDAALENNEGYKDYRKAVGK